MQAPVNLADLPLDAGCYLYRDEHGTVIYIGKAKNLRKRVSSYFSKTHTDQKTIELVQTLRSVEVIITDTEAEALLLEARLIRQHKPVYNVMLKDNRRYAYIEITDEEVPRIRTARDTQGKGSYYGPYVDGSARAAVIRTLNAAFQLRSCRVMPKKVCLYYHIGRCSGPCEGKISVDEYRKRVEQARAHLEGKTEFLKEQLRVEMLEAAQRKEFELAKLKRDQLFALESLGERQKVDMDLKYNQDFIAHARNSTKMIITVFTINKGKIVSKHDFMFDSPMEESAQIMRQFVQQYYAENVLPSEIVVDEFDEEAIPVLEKTFSEQAKIGVSIIIPQRGIKKELLEMVKKNANYALFGVRQELVRLEKALRLPELPKIIECFDISTLQGTHTVASMVQFRDGDPDKSQYRRFKIKTVVGQDDFASMKEVVRRRYYGLLKQNVPLPHLVMIDGGAGQLHAAMEAMTELGVRIPVISLAKREEEIYVPGLHRPLRLDKRSAELRLLQHIRDEAHRFAISYHKLLRDKALVGK